MKAMILAAGLGERMRPLTLTTPKPLLEVNGKPLIHYHLEKLAAAGFREVVINVSWLGDQIKARLGSGQAWGLTLRYSEEARPLETAGGILQALDDLTEDCDQFAVVNGDIWTDLDFQTLNAPQLGDDLAHLFLVSNPAHHPKGDFSLGPDQRVILKSSGPQDYTFSGISVLHKRLLTDTNCPANRLAPFLMAAIEQDKVTGSVIKGQWWDIGTPDRLDAVNRLARMTPDTLSR